MIIIKVNNKFSIEKKYIIDVIFGDFLKLDYILLFREQIKNYEITLENGNNIIIKDHFFSKFKNEVSYLEKENIPDKVIFTQNQFLIESNIPVIYGDNELKINKNKIICGVDIFASAFFMLTRWEEYVNKTRDKHNRFPAPESLAYKNDFIYRPVVNEYVEMLWNMLLALGIKQDRKIRKFEMILTHDVDNLLKYNNIFSGSKEIIGDLIKRRDLRLSFKSLKSKLLFHAGIKKDPFDTFDYLMDISEKINTKSYFFLIGKGTSEFDNKYILSDKFLKSVIEKIKVRGHKIGFHPSYNTYNDRELFEKEKIELEEYLGIKLRYGRQHYLRFSVPETWQIWEDSNMEWDSTLSYPEKEGFRCGTCYAYSAFNFLNRKKLRVKEKPLIVMDGSFVDYQPEISPDEMENKIYNLVKKCRKYKGTFVFNWHNSSFGALKWEPFSNVYENILIHRAGSNL